MDVLYIPQLDEIGSGGEGEGGGGTAARYRILRRVPEDGTVLLADRAVTRVEIANGAGPLRLVVPPEAKGAARDFFVRLVITADEVPEVTFAAPAGEAISFEDADEDVFKCEVGVNVFAFTETDAPSHAHNLQFKRCINPSWKRTVTRWRRMEPIEAAGASAPGINLMT